MKTINEGAQQGLLVVMVIFCFLFYMTTFKIDIICPFICYWLGIELEKAMAPHSSTLAWKIPWTEEPGRLQSMGLLRVGHN